jgi:hypothetical protein
MMPARKRNELCRARGSPKHDLLPSTEQSYWIPCEETARTPILTLLNSSKIRYSDIYHLKKFKNVLSFPKAIQAFFQLVI